MSVVGLLEAATNPQLLGATITWRPRQLDVLRQFGDDSLRLVVCAAGRQGGKSTMAVVTALWGATMRDDLDRILPRGRIRYALIAAPSESQSRELIRVAAGMIEASPVLRSMATLPPPKRFFIRPCWLPSRMRVVRHSGKSSRIAHFSVMSDRKSRRFRNRAFLDVGHVGQRTDPMCLAALGTTFLRNGGSHACVPEEAADPVER